MFTLERNIYEALMRISFTFSTLSLLRSLLLYVTRFKPRCHIFRKEMDKYDKIRYDLKALITGGNPFLKNKLFRH